MQINVFPNFESWIIIIIITTTTTIITIIIIIKQVRQQKVKYNWWGQVGRMPIESTQVWKGKTGGVASWMKNLSTCYQQWLSNPWSPLGFGTSLPIHPRPPGNWVSYLMCRQLCYLVLTLFSVLWRIARMCFTLHHLSRLQIPVMRWSWLGQPWRELKMSWRLVQEQRGLSKEWWWRALLLLPMVSMNNRLSSYIFLWHEEPSSNL